jgi:transcriptional regulator with XRE-family HTH domain
VDEYQFNEDGGDVMTFSELIKQKRYLSEMTLQAVANETGMSKAHIWELETGRSCNPSLKTAKLLANCLGFCFTEYEFLEDE